MSNVVVKPKAEKFLSKVDRKTRERIFEILLILESDPLPYKTYDLKKLKGYENRYRIRMGKIRILYEFSLINQTITIYKIDYRERAY